MALDGTYAGLLATIAVMGKSTGANFTAAIPDFVTLAEARINRRLRVRAMESAFTLSATGGEPRVALPTGYVGFNNIYMNDDAANPLQYLPSEQFRTQFSGSVTGKPTSYTIEGENLVLGPVPDTDYTLKGICYLTLSPLSTMVNSVFTSNPDLYLFGALAEAWDFQDQDTQTQKYLARFESAAIQIQERDTQDRISGSVLTVRTDVTYA
jgi:hypothetical protein